MESNTNQTLPSEQEQSSGQIISVGHLFDYLKRLTDSRKRRGLRYALDVLLTLFILAKLCGQNKPSGIADWAQLRTEYFCDVLNFETQNYATPQHVSTDIERHCGRG